MAVLAACSPSESAKKAAQASPPPARSGAGSAPTPAAAGAPASAALYGAPFEPGQPITVGAALESAAAESGKLIQLAGQVRRVCQRKGCWMELAGDNPDQAVRVTFKDYGFFMPLDSAGSRAWLQGELQSKYMDPATVRHLEEEGAVIANKTPEGGAHQVEVVASGVRLWR
ncbi:MAG: hypothetical protein GMKNLPBB_02798 [Myxococcota bacterium]|nr:hypothetical protein [Myxococcota bacterium]